MWNEWNELQSEQKVRGRSRAQLNPAGPRHLNVASSGSWWRLLGGLELPAPLISLEYTVVGAVGGWWGGLIQSRAAVRREDGNWSCICPPPLLPLFAPHPFSHSTIKRSPHRACNPLYCTLQGSRHLPLHRPAWTKCWIHLSFVYMCECGWFIGSYLCTLRYEVKSVVCGNKSHFE